jgi:hypothetical protein
MSDTTPSHIGSSLYSGRIRPERGAFINASGEPITLQAGDILIKTETYWFALYTARAEEKEGLTTTEPIPFVPPTGDEPEDKDEDEGTASDEGPQGNQGPEGQQGDQSAEAKEEDTSSEQ